MDLETVTGDSVPEGKVPVWEMNFSCGHSELWQEYRWKGRSLSSSPLFCAVEGLRGLEHFSVNVSEERFLNLSINQPYSVSFCNTHGNTSVHSTAVEEKISLYIAQRNQRLKQLANYGWCCAELSPKIITFKPPVW